MNAPFHRLFSTEAEQVLCASRTKSNAAPGFVGIAAVVLTTTTNPSNAVLASAAEVSDIAGPFLKVSLFDQVANGANSVGCKLLKLIPDPRKLRRIPKRVDLLGQRDGFIGKRLQDRRQELIA